MNKKILLAIIFISVTFTSFAQIKLSDKAEASLITVGPGKVIYSLWGHSIFRINDPGIDLDLVYNFGVVPFGDPDFMKNFIFGNLWYEVEESKFEPYIKWYTSLGRTLREIKLDLTRDEVQQLFDYMRWHSLDENKRYLYLFFHDNCATRIRDMFNYVKDVHLEIPPIDRKRTLRQLIAPYLDNYSWAKFGLFFLLNSIVDKPVTSADTMNFPDYLEKYFMVGRIVDKDGSRDLVNNKTSVPLNNLKFEKPAEDFWYSPLMVFSLVFILAVFLSIMKKKAFLFDYLLFIITGLAGCLLVFIWFFTNHIYGQANWNLVWAFPLHLFAAFLIFRESKITIWYFRVNCIILLLLFPATFFIPQKIPFDAVPLIFTLFIRSFVLGRVNSLIPDKILKVFAKFGFLKQEKV